MATLTGKTPAATYKSLLRVADADNQEIDGTLRVIEDGNGNDTALSLANDSVLVRGSGTKLYFHDADGEYISGDGTDLTITSGTDILLAPGGNVGIGTTTPTYNLEVKGGDAANDITTGGGQIALVGSDTSLVDGDDIGTINFIGADTTLTSNKAVGAKILAEAAGNWDSTSDNDAPTELQFWTTNDGPSDAIAQRMVIDKDGTMFIGKTSSTLTNTGHEFFNNGYTAHTRADTVMALNREDSDGTIVALYGDGNLEGVISVTNDAISYGEFCGSHYTELSDGTAQSSLLIGTVLDSVGVLVENSFEKGKRLPKCKVNTDADSAGVYGVYQGDFKSETVEAKDAVLDEDGNIIEEAVEAVPSSVIGLNAAGLGAYFVRVNKDVTVAIGDLLVSNGDGTAKKQDDDIIRSKTIGKVTSTTKKETYDDGSYIVPCVLYCG